jgi:hypothetical protein
MGAARSPSWQSRAKDGAENGRRGGSGRLLHGGQGGHGDLAAPPEPDLVAGEVEEPAPAFGAGGSTEKPRSEERDETTGEHERCDDEDDSASHVRS